jgi:hypothetical protein
MITRATERGCSRSPGHCCAPVRVTLYDASDLQSAGLGDEAIRRLEAVGLVRWRDEDRLGFSSDRILNWAVAEHLARRMVVENWSPDRAEEKLRRVDELAETVDSPLGYRLGYVFLDAIWLLTQSVRPAWVADLLYARASRVPHAWRSEQMWADHLATVGETLLPTLEQLAQRPFEEERDYDIPANVARTIAVIGKHNREPIVPLADRLLSMAGQTAADTGLAIARRLPLPELVEQLWAIHLDRQRTWEMAGNSDERRHGQLLSLKQESWDALRLAVNQAPRWLDRQLGSATEPVELEQLLWLLIDERLDENKAQAMWAKHRSRLQRCMPSNSAAMISALGHFVDVESRGWLDRVSPTSADWKVSRVLRSRARLDPSRAIQQIRERQEDHGWSAATWWLPELARADPAGLAAAIRENASRGDHPLTDVVLHYAHFPELMDLQTLEWVLDEFAGELRLLNDRLESGSGEQVGRLGHPLRFLISLIEPWQFDCLAKRVGTPLEAELVRFAVRRGGRNSRVRDHEGSECERLLALIGGDGFAELVIAKLARRSPFGREDGYVAAQWTEAKAVTAALAATNEQPEPDSFRQVVRMQALAVHCRDAQLEAMIREGCPVFLNAAAMRKAEGRPTGNLLERVRELVTSRQDEDVRVGAQLAGFLIGPNDAQVLVPAFLSAKTSEPVKQAMTGTFWTLSFYDPSLLPAAKGLIDGRMDQEAQFTASYLAACGDANARGVVCEWLEGLDLGTWSSSYDAFLQPLLGHVDSRPAVLRFLRRSRDNGHLLIDGRYLRLLAEEGDREAHDELVRAAYRAPRFGDQSTISGIEYLSTLDSEEAFFAARRFLARHGATAALDLLLRIDAARAIPILLERYRFAPPSERWDIARRLRRHLTPERQQQLLGSLAQAPTIGDRVIAAELAGWMPPSVALNWLEEFANGSSAKLRAAALESLRKRAFEAAATKHLRAMSNSPKTLRWARLQTIFECVDPAFLWSRSDAASLQQFLSTSPPEFEIAARQLRSARVKAVQDQAKKADRQG